MLFSATHASLLRLTMVIPWNTLPVQAAFLGRMLLVLTRRDGPAVAWLAALAAVTYGVRPGDAACFAPLLVFATLRLPTWRARLGWGALGVALIAVSAGAMAWLNVRTFGHWRTPYEQGTFENIGFFSYPMLHKVYWLLVDGETFFGEYGTALLWRYPWLFLALPGVVFWVRRDGVAGAACVATIGVCVGDRRQTEGVRATECGNRAKRSAGVAGGASALDRVCRGEAGPHRCVAARRTRG